MPRALGEYRREHAGDNVPIFQNGLDRTPTGTLAARLFRYWRRPAPKILAFVLETNESQPTGESGQNAAQDVAFPGKGPLYGRAKPSGRATLAHLEIPATTIAIIGGRRIDQNIGATRRRVDDEPETHRIFPGVGHNQAVFARW